MSTTFVQKVMDGDLAAAKDEFNNLMAEKLSDALDAEKVAISAEIYNGISRDELEEDVTEITLDDLDDREEVAEGEYKADENKKAKQKKYVPANDKGTEC